MIIVEETVNTNKFAQLQTLVFRAVNSSYRFVRKMIYSVKRSDVTGNPFEWPLGENNVI